MCDPTMLFAATTVASLGSAALGGESDYAEYGKKVRAINEEAEAINKSTVFKYQLSNLQAQQIQDKRAAEVGGLKAKLGEATGTAEAAAATGGVEGNSVTALLNGFAAATGKDLMVVNQQAGNELTQVEMDKRGIKMDADNRKTSIRNQLPDDPTSKVVGRFIGAALNIGYSYIKNSTKTADGSGLFGRRLG